MLVNHNEYLALVESIKGEIKSAQYKAAVSVNRDKINRRRSKRQEETPQ
ncbi:MAG: hypothetical protein NC084_04775 [Bacteroides sp.]|nr:hypothetical protein [Eubacterium sp.]MCM1418764.1 hypothetical protein [Roseburia sp.]MCM1462009.1 hypothetical protein [Bacteroides sp.]